MILQPADALQKKIIRARDTNKGGLDGLSAKDLAWLTVQGAKTVPALVKAERISRGMDERADDGLTIEEFSALVGELWEFVLRFVPRDKLREAKREFFRVLKKYGSNAEDTGP